MLANSAAQLPWWLTVEAATFEPFAAEEIDQLQRFLKVVHELQRKALFSTPARFTFGPDGSRIEFAGEDSLEAAMNCFRQFMLKRDDVRFDRITQLLLSRLSPHVRKQQQPKLGLTGLEREWNALLAETLLSYAAVDEAGTTMVTGGLTAEEVMNRWFYGGVHHTQKQNVGSLAGWPEHRVRFQITKVIHRGLDVLGPLAEVVRTLLGDPRVARPRIPATPDP